VRARDYAGPEDLRLVQRLASECWRLEGPLVYMTVGDVAWQMYQHVDKLNEFRIRLWLDEDGEPLAWGWLWLPNTLVQLTHPSERERLVEAVLDWFEEEAAPGEGEGWTSVRALEADRATVAAVERRGFVCAPDGALNHTQRPLSMPIPAPELPDGYQVRTVAGDEDVERRVEVHRAAFAPSRVVPESYRRLMQEPAYRSDLDFVIEAPDGSFAAFCLCWLDAENLVGEFEPVGTHPEHQRLGLGRAVCLAGLRGLRAAGADTAVVFSNPGSAGERLYAALGFETISRHLEFRKLMR